MKKIFIGALFLLFGGSAAMAQDTTAIKPTTTVAPIVAPAPVPVGPSMLFDEPKFNYGEIKQGDVIEHGFKFTNNGTLPLIIYDVKTTCGCTVSEYPQAPVMPGETAIIKARFDSAKKRGQQNKVLIVESNAVQGNAQIVFSSTIASAN
ncbi:DUF1573 domain-containing protein [Rufibacter tibetensis]|uniref:DUF1573 domain-containing protein n=1 Tax=Rufibacter tibetensis TaxID=512763 RepID=A0A0P0D3A4_9BACT|nr:DUF1573 domain-containing protein [Rufibacter tibetensis]ALJ01598.1 hypothetical protein DC20_20125 [Rufibacter tibetensis]